VLFYTPEFVVFSIVLLAILGVVHRAAPRKLVLLVASYVFYMWWNPAFLLLILLATGTNYVFAGRIAATDSEPARRAWMGASLAVSLGVLAFFKYGTFIQENTLVAMQALGYEPHWTTLQILLPVGISFYTFQCLSYTIDIYRRQLEPARSALDFALFVAFFPQLVAGPIVRARDFLPQLEGRVRVRCEQRSFFLVLRGLAKKVLIADNIALFADGVFTQPEAYPSVVIWLGAICFAVQIYCDFSGYSDIAIGVARILGFEIPRNFDYPYLARNPSDFWRRWHISLSSWLRDYLYISLGGNRGSSAATYRNLMLTMLLGGLWHGASWNFVLWGFLHGAILVAHRAYTGWRARRDPGFVAAPLPIVRLLSILAMQYWVLLTWITFRVTDFATMGVALQKFVWFDFDFGLANLGLGRMSFFSTLLLLGVFGVLHAVSARVGQIDEALGRVPLPIAALVCFAAGFAALCLWPLTEAPFIYFQF
jgi:alginate O-acetyltransferase complex protein AlgI